MALPPEVARMLSTLLSDIQERLRDHLVGLYLRGSLAMGDFITETSDIDALAVTERPIDNAQFAALAGLHARLAALPNLYANRLEIAYIDHAALRRFQPGLRHLTLGQGETLAWSEHRDNWVLERWTVRECGVTLLGPNPRSLIDPISSDELRAAVRARLRDWADWANQPDDPDWLLPRAHNAYVVETMCRALHTLTCGEVRTKPRAVAWALEALPDPWRSTVQRSQAWRADDTPDPDIVPQVLRFVGWAASLGYKR